MYFNIIVIFVVTAIILFYGLFYYINSIPDKTGKVKMKTVDKTQLNLISVKKRRQ